MRISTNPKDRSYRADFGKFKVTLNGVRLYDFITVDDDIGMVLQVKRNEHGWQIAGFDGVVLRETVYGRVKINRVA